MVAGAGAGAPGWFVCGVFCGSMLWWTLLSCGAGSLRSILAARAHRLNQGAAVTLAAFGIWALWNAGKVIYPRTSGEHPAIADETSGHTLPTCTGLSRRGRRTVPASVGRRAVAAISGHDGVCRRACTLRQRDQRPGCNSRTSRRKWGQGNVGLWQARRVADGPVRAPGDHSPGTGSGGGDGSAIHAMRVRGVRAKVRSRGEMDLSDEEQRGPDTGGCAGAGGVLRQRHGVDVLAPGAVQPAEGWCAGKGRSRSVSRWGSMWCGEFGPELKRVFRRK